MNDLISRQAALDAIWEIFCNRQLDSDRWVLADVREKIESIPSAQSDRKECEEREQGKCPWYAG